MHHILAPVVVGVVVNVVVDGVVALQVHPRRRDAIVFYVRTRTQVKAGARQGGEEQEEQKPEQQEQQEQQEGHP